ncbi:MAG: TetR family transcriptional regulator [Pseudonocardiaceae bacterium]|nr:TetR family transcriptional regulator [Pseudonocardiaceae bacterium]
MTRGAHLLDAALSVIAEQGAAKLSVRTVAAAARVSPAQVQYYYRTKNDLVRAGFAYAGEQFLADVRAAGPDTLHDLVLRWLPLDERRDRRARVWLAYAATAAVDPWLAGESARLDAGLRAWFAGELAELGVADPESAGAQVLAMVDGVTVGCLALPMTERAALVARTVTPFLATLVS